MIALVTGASSGIGYAYACRLAEMKYDLVLVSNEADKIVEVGTELSSKYGIKAKAVYADLATPDAAVNLFNQCIDMDISVLVNNAGCFFFDKLIDVPIRKIELMINLHVVTPTLLCRLFAAKMVERGGGYILNMSSLSSTMKFPGISTYASTKSYLKHFTISMHREMKDQHVVFTAICPGAVATDLYGLSEKYKKLAIRLGIMMPADKLADIGLKSMFAGRASCTPGFINKLFTPLLVLMPAFVVNRIKRIVFKKLLNK